MPIAADLCQSAQRVGGRTDELVVPIIAVRCQLLSFYQVSDWQPGGVVREQAKCRPGWCGTP
jgi:hypothetical protein